MNLLTRPTRRPNEALRQLEKAVGGREALAEALHHPDLDPRQQAFVRLLMDPENGKRTLETLAADAGMAPIQVYELLRQSAVAKSLAHAQGVIAEHLPSVVASVATKAKDHLAPCPCTLLGDRPPQRDCPQCQGGGRLVKQGAYDYAELLLEAAQMLRKDPATVVNVQQQTMVGTPQFFDKFVRAVSTIDVIKETPHAALQHLGTSHGPEHPEAPAPVDGAGPD